MLSGGREGLLDSGDNSLFIKYFPKIEKLTKPDEISVYDSILEWFTVNQLILRDDISNMDYESILNKVKNADSILKKLPFIVSVAAVCSSFGSNGKRPSSQVGSLDIIGGMFSSIQAGIPF